MEQLPEVQHDSRSKKRHYDIGRPSRHSPSRYKSQSRNIIMNVHQFFAQEGSCETMEKVVQKTATATRVSMNTVERIKAEAKKSPNGVICSPTPSSRPSPVVGQLDDFDRECIRREPLSFYERGELPTLSALLERVKQPPLSFQGSQSSLYKIVKKLWFKYRKVQSSRKILMEREDI
ncbi:hypothetical protein Hamer_G007530 [Homarus americanus]|uniref:Uncharacterized protein n=1 Tax=Homarus americanus TaxID=6706 RepID=A0A8J5JNW3_HOMAM|nr:hypothetical protein Hamer_G007530 [Homarus americanus]